jgi:FMN phosphatase YigB (HAD superfamily)
MLSQFKVLLLDMNDTFMFGADRFSGEDDYAVTYEKLNQQRKNQPKGQLLENDVNYLIQTTYNYLERRYTDPDYRECFPSVRSALIEIAGEQTLNTDELDLLTQTFAYHELGNIPPAYAASIRALALQFRIGLVTDIWSPKELSVAELQYSGIWPCCETAVFSADTGMVKPSPQPFLQALTQMQIDRMNAANDVLVIGDSVQRDLGGATAAGLPCLLVGGATHPKAYGTAKNLLELVKGESGLAQL